MTDSTIKDQVKEATDIVGIIGQYVTMKKRGANYLGLCPFHTEKTPSFSVHGDRQFYHCFGCGRGGDVYSFLMEHEGWSFPETLKYCADRAGIRLPERRSDDSREARRRQAIFDALAMADETFQRSLFGSKGQAALEYLRNRGFKDQTLKHAGVGYAPSAFDTMARMARARGIHEKALLAAGLSMESKHGERPYDRFRNRITFPIRNLSGKTVAFGARAIAPDDQPKYLNSPETDLYHKGSILYGLSAAREAIRRSERVLVCEGYMDWLTLLEYGFENVVAISGTAMTEQQAKLLARFCNCITLVFDADSAGHRAALRGIDVAFNAGLAVDVVALPPDDDPDSFLRREGAEKLQAVLNAAPGIVEYRIDRLRAEGGGMGFIDNEKLAKEFAELAGKIGEPTRRDAFISEVAGYLRIPEDRLRQSVRTAHGPPSRQSPGSVLPESLPKEEEFLRILIEDSDYLDRARAEVQPGDFEVPLHQRMYKTLLDRTAEGQKVSTPEDLGPERDEIVQWARLLSHPLDADLVTRVFPDALKRFGERRLRARLLEIKQQIAQADREGNHEAINRLIEERKRVLEESS